MPVLSLILCSRNDQYMGNSRWRLETTLNYLAQRIRELGRENDVDVLVADWGSDIPLSEVLQLSPAAAKIVSWLLIPPEIARPLQKDSPFPEVLALNAAARRATGEYIGRIDQDTLVGRRFLEFFFELYEGKQQLDVPLASALLFANRRSIPYRLAVRCPAFGHVDRVVRLFGSSLGVWNENRFCRNVFWTSYVGIWLLHRDLWMESGGYDERLLYMNWMETDMILRLTQRQRIIDLGALTNYDFYHLEHYDPRTPLRASSHRKVNPSMKLDNPRAVFNPNGETWGMSGFPLEVRQTSANLEIKRAEATRTSVLRFILLVLSVAMQITSDRVIVTLTSVWLFWRRRALVARNGIADKPITMWPGLLVKLWKGRSARLLGVRN